MAEFAKHTAGRIVDEQFTFSSRRTKQVVYGLVVMTLLAITVGVYFLVT